MCKVILVDDSPKKAKNSCLSYNLVSVPLKNLTLPVDLICRVGIVWGSHSCRSPISLHSHSLRLVVPCWTCEKCASAAAKQDRPSPSSQRPLGWRDGGLKSKVLWLVLARFGVWQTVHQKWVSERLGLHEGALV